MNETQQFARCSGPAAHVRQAIHFLPPTAQGIATMLKREEVKGRRSSPCSCPLAKWLKRMECVKAVDVSAIDAFVRLSGDDRSVLVDLPAAAEEFVNEFDRGQWPDLEER